MEVEIREAEDGELALVTGFLRRMMEEMAAFGGPPVASAEAAWTELAETIAQERREGELACFLACRDCTPLGMVAAHVVEVGGVLAPKRTLHVSAVYVVPSSRRQGLARRLLNVALDWGRAAGCVEADLHALVHNPARALYEELGFATVESKMVRPL